MTFGSYNPLAIVATATLTLSGLSVTLIEEGTVEALVGLLCSCADVVGREAACEGLAHLTPADARVCGYLLDFGACASLVSMLHSSTYVLLILISHHSFDL